MCLECLEVSDSDIPLSADPCANTTHHFISVGGRNIVI